MSQPSDRPALKAWFAAIPVRRVALASGVLEYARTGRGAAVLALHGAMGGYDQGLLLARATLGDVGDFDVVAPSRPAYRGTPLDSGRSPEDQADLYAELLDALGIGRVIVLAVSGGGPSAIEFAARHPGRCRALVLVSACTGRLDVPEEYRGKVDRMVRLAGFAPFRWLTALMGRFAPEKALARSIEDPGVLAQTLADPQSGPLIRWLQQSTMNHMAERMPGTINDIRNGAAITALPMERIASPALVIHGAADRVVPPSHGEEAARRIPGARLLAIAGGEHVCLFTHLADIRQRVNAFLAELD